MDQFFGTRKIDCKDESVNISEDDNEDDSEDDSEGIGKNSSENDNEDGKKDNKQDDNKNNSKDCAPCHASISFSSMAQVAFAVFALAVVAIAWTSAIKYLEQRNDNEIEKQQADVDSEEDDTKDVSEADSGNIKMQAKSDPDNQDCLIRLYLGARQSESPDSLRNFPLHLDLLEEIGLDIVAYAASMVIGLAVMHWGAFVNGMDCEFVLGGIADSERRSEAGEDDNLDESPHSL